ncbi:MAG TPA: DUF1036 domain-containing protein [Rhizomicrobium sp.]|nr:DUF1036 domain-containing protein [Rhizomicrobium sp.]
MRPIAALILLLIVPARADFTVCNKADTAAKLAFGFFNGKAWESRGWWTVGPQKCETLVTGRLKSRYYYLYGTDGASGTWNGDTPFCTASQPSFIIAGRGNCAARGFDRNGFFAVDTGNSPNWKQSLAD